MTGRQISRRNFLKYAGLTLAVVATPSGYSIISAKELGEAGEKVFSPGVWLQIADNNTITVILNKAEMGQGVYTSLPMLVADELEADWRQIRIKVAPAGEIYKDPVWGAQATGGSSSIRHMYAPLRTAAAAAREMLVEAAAKTWGVPQSECAVMTGHVRHATSDRKMTFGQLSVMASSLSIPKSPSLKKESLFSIIGTSVPRLDLPEKVNGTAIFGIDVFVPGMLYASVARPPAYGSGMVSYDKAAALGIKGVTDVVPLHQGIAVCAETLEAARKGSAALNSVWGKGTDPGMDNDTLEALFIRALDKKGVMARKEGNAGTALEHAVKKVGATYLLPFLAHATMEPMNCTADVRPDRCEIWAPTQNQTGVLKAAEKETGLRPDQISVHTTFLGGGFGRRFETDVVAEALSISKSAGRPVKLIWSREEDMQNDFYRPANCSRIEGALDKDGQMVAWSHKIACPSIFSRVFPAQVKEGIDPAAVEGLKNMEYEVPNIDVEYVKTDTPVPVGFWRSVGSSHNAFTVESFMDEMAHAAGKDPLEFRLQHLKRHPRATRVLQYAAEKAGWHRPLAGAGGRGVAAHFSFESYVAQIAEVTVNRKDGNIRVHRVVCAVDCGPVVNPAIVKAQMTGGIIMGLSAALQERIDFAKGGVSTANFNDYEILRMSRAPEIEVHIIKSNESLGGVGEPGLPPIAPAVANAVFHATGIRLRRLPMRPADVSEAIDKL